MLSIHDASCTLYRLKMHADTANDWYCYSSYDVYSTSMNMLSIGHAYTAWYRPIMHTYMTSITSACKRLYMLTCYRSILYFHDIDRWYMLYMSSIHNASCIFHRWNMHADTTMIDTVTAHIMYILHLRTCYLLIMHILHDIYLSWSLQWHRSLMHACCLVKLLSIYNNDIVHMMYVLHIWTCYRLIMPLLTWHWTLMHVINQCISTVYH